MKRKAIPLFALLAAGCTHKPALNTYRLVPTALVPPGVSGPTVARRTFTAQIDLGRGSCAVSPGPIRLEAHKRGLRISVDRDALVEQRQPGWLSDWTLRLEGQGCIATGEGQRLGRAIVESVPLDSSVAYRLLNSNTISYVELNGQNQLEVRSPILRDDSPAAPIGEIVTISGQGAKIDVDLKLSSNVIGFEIDWYAVQPNSGRPGYRLGAISAERYVQGVVERSAAPATNYFAFPPAAAYFRLCYKRDDNGVTAIVVAGTTRQDLDRRTHAVGADPDSCQREAGMCLTLPHRVGVNPFLVVHVNGKSIAAPFSASVRDAITSVGVRAPDRVVAQLRVTRLYGGQPRPVEFDRKRQDILNLKLAGGETLDW